MNAVFKIGLLTLAIANAWLPLRSAPASAGQSAPTVQPLHAAKLHATPGGFIPNVGQLCNSAATFVLREGGMSAYFMPEGFVLWNGQSTTVLQDGLEVKVPLAPRWSIVGAKSVGPVGGETLPHTVGFFRGNDPAKWHSNVPAYRELRYPEILNGIELRVESREHGFEYSFRVQPHAKSDLHLRYDSISSLEKSPAGDLIVRTATSHFTESRPVSYQIIKGTRREVASTFELVSANEYRIAVGPYDPQHELIIDPVLDWSTSVGGSFGEQLNVVKVDGTGDVICAGWSYSADLPVTLGFAPFGTAPGDNLGADPNWPEFTDLYIAKFSADGTQLRWAGYLGGNGEANEVLGRNKGLAVDTAGDLYVIAYTRASDFPILPVGASVYHGLSDASVTKIKSDGSAILWSRLLGGSDEDWGYALTLEGQNLYVAGQTRSTDFSGSTGQFGGMQDGFVAKLNAGDGTVSWTSFLGGSLEERIAAVVADPSGVIVFGDTDSTDFLTTPGAFDRTLNGGNDSFVAKLRPDGSGVQWSTFLGGSGAETGHPGPSDQFNLTYARADMAMDSTGNIVVVGQTYSADFPKAALAFKPHRTGNNDAYVAKLRFDGTDLIWASYLGGSGQQDAVGREELASAVAVNPWDEIFIAGWTLSPSPTFPITPDALKGTLQADGFFDGFLTKINPNGTAILYSTYIGNDGLNDPILGLEYDAFGNVLVCGWHLDTWSHITAGSYLRECNNCGAETYVMKFLDAFIAHDGFESGTYNGGSGGWAGAWTATGDTSIVSSIGPHAGSRHVRLRTSTGYLQRTANIPIGSTTLGLGLWAKVNSFENSDKAIVLAKSTGANFSPVLTLSSEQSVNKYHYYEIDLSRFLPATQIQIAFDATMNASDDSWYLDDIRLTGTSVPVPPLANAGPDQTVTDTDNNGTEAVNLNGSASIDPDGGGIVAYQWKEGTTLLGTSVTISPSLSVGVHTITLTVTDDEGVSAGDTIQVTVNPYQAAVQVFYDSFEVSEWNGLWIEDSQNDWSRSSARKTVGNWSAELTGNASNSSLTSPAVNLQGRNNATITFDWQIASSLDTGEYLEFRTSTNGGSTWIQKAILRGDVDAEGVWNNVSVELSAISQLKVQFRGSMNKSDERANLDNVRVVAH